MFVTFLKLDSLSFRIFALLSTCSKKTSKFTYKLYFHVILSQGTMTLHKTSKIPPFFSLVLEKNLCIFHARSTSFHDFLLSLKENSQFTTETGFLGEIVKNIKNFSIEKNIFPVFIFHQHFISFLISLEYIKRIVILCKFNCNCFM